MRSTLHIKYLKIAILIILLCTITRTIPINVEAKEQENNLVNIYLFHLKSCSHCNEEIKFLDKIEKKYPNIKVYRFEVHEKNNNENRLKVQELYNLKGNSVPLTIIGDTPYTGYSKEISNVTFIKTIKYYSKYSYEDRVGKLLGIEKISTYNKDEGIPTLEEFLETYGNYKLIGTLTTNDLDATSNSLLLGILSSLNKVKITTLIIMTIIVAKKRLDYFVIPSYLTLSMLYNLINTLTNKDVTITSAILITIIILTMIISIIYYLKNKKDFDTPKKLCKLNVVLKIINIISYIEIKSNILYHKAFKEIIILHNLEGIDKINYYINYIFITLTIYILSILICYKVKNRIKESEKQA